MKKLIVALSLVLATFAATASAKEVEPTESACQSICVNGKCMLCCTYGNQTICT